MMEEIEGIQLSVYEALLGLEDKVRGGFFGRGDDFDTEALEEDLNDILLVAQ